jgi:hypothetical protein
MKLPACSLLYITRDFLLQQEMEYASLLYGLRHKALLLRTLLHVTATLFVLSSYIICIISIKGLCVTYGEV